MSRTFYQKVTAEIQRRKKEQLKKEAEEKKAKNEEARGEILKVLDEVIEANLQILEDYDGDLIFRDYNANNIYNFEENAKELGFQVDFEPKVRSSDFNSYCLSVPAFEKGNKRTPAQLRIYKFKQALSTARNERQMQLLTECKRVKQVIEENVFEYRSANKLNPARIFVPSEVKVKNTYEKYVVKDFFSKLKLHFIGSSSGKWAFEPNIFLFPCKVFKFFFQ